MNLYKHQRNGVDFLAERPSAALFWEMGVGKSRAVLAALEKLPNVDRCLILCPSAVRYAWGEELGKVLLEGFSFDFVSYRPDKYEENQFVIVAHANQGGGKLFSLPNARKIQICVVSYGLLQLESCTHMNALRRWLLSGENSVLVCDESSFLKSRTAQRTKSAIELSKAADYRWLLTGTPIANNPLDLWAQGEVMCPYKNDGYGRRDGPLHGFTNFYHFRARYSVMGGYKQKQVVKFKNLDDLTERFAPYVSRIEKKDCLDLPPKIYMTREVALTQETWKIYQELKRDAIMILSEDETQIEPNAAVRLMRLCQITSGYFGTHDVEDNHKDVSDEKLQFVLDSLMGGELSNERTLIVWCRWRRERERLSGMMERRNIFPLQIYGGQSNLQRVETLDKFNSAPAPVYLLAQQQAGGYGLNLARATTAVYLSNDYSYTTRIQSEDRMHRVGQTYPCTYIDILATGPDGQRTVDHRIVKALHAKEDIARWTCQRWRRELEY